MRYNVITAVYNAGQYFDRYADSILAQDYDNYRVVIVDDHSSDGTADRVRERCEGNDWLYFLRDTHRGALYNQVMGIRSLECGSDDVLVFVDGDDQLAHPNVFQTLDYYYGQGAKLTYGQYQSVPYARTCQLAAPFPGAIMDVGDFRMQSAMGHGIFWNHLRTFKYELFSQLTDADFKDAHGGWYKTATDAALMYPCLELARPHIAFIPEVLYLYTSDNPISDWRIAARQCDSDHGHILARTPKR